MDRHFVDADARVVRMRALLDDNAWREKGHGSSAVAYAGADNWIKVEAHIDAPFAVLLDILDTHLEDRQAQWHELLIEGRVLLRHDKRALCWFAYRSPWPLWNRDTRYAMQRVDVAPGEALIGCWTVSDDELMPPLPEKRYVRIDFECLFHVCEIPEGGVQYRYLQRSDPRVALVPDSMLVSGQCSIVLREVEGLRSASRLPMGTQ